MPDDKLAVTIRRNFTASPERVFDAWLDPQMVRYWFAPGLGEMTRVEIDAREGGHFHLDQQREDGLARHWGTYRVVDRAHRLSFTWCVDGVDGADEVELEFEATSGGCQLTITHWMDPSFADYVEPTQRGWGMMSDGLQEGLYRTGGHGELIAEDSIRFERLLPGPIERVWAWLTESDKRAQWLAAGEMPHKPGESFAFTFHHDSLSPDDTETPQRFADLKDGVETQHRFTRWNAPNALGITWGGGKEGESEVLFELSEQGERVRLVLTHTRLAKDKLANVSGGWHTHFAILQSRLAEAKVPRFWPLFEDLEAHYKRTLKLQD